MLNVCRTYDILRYIIVNLLSCDQRWRRTSSENTIDTISCVFHIELTDYLLVVRVLKSGYIELGVVRIHSAIGIQLFLNRRVNNG